jgi:ubiquilin
MAMLGGGGGGGMAPAPPDDPGTAYASQLQQLQEMGFYDRDANIRHLLATGGNVNAAVERLLSSI